MSKLLKKFKLKNLIFTISVLIIGVVIGGVVGVTATTNRLEAKYVMYTKDGETVTVQDAIKDLYVKAKNGSNQTLPIGTLDIAGQTIYIPYTGTYKSVYCVYGTDENYGNVGTISNSKCNLTGLTVNTKYYYKVIGYDNVGNLYETKGETTTVAKKPTKVTTGLPTGVKAIVYLDPTDLTRYCDESNSTVGSGMSGCMKWYAFSEDNTIYTMILDHNAKTHVPMSTNGSEEAQTELNNLVTTTGWKVTLRLISKQDIVDITGTTASYFDANCTNDSGGCNIGENKYYWLFDYLSNCTKWGCKVADTDDSGNNGYWSSTHSNCYGPNNDAVFTNGSYSGCYGSDSTSFGIRPVITVPKSNF